ncbi:capsular polysaccharide biosynthesis protein [Pararhizobium sp. BT-229]|uniref:capsular polysaccharide export protein, LipB/KpsS family n=1 Tax=Pararhizobium sp. BT-229 TaxID=2986923 RepID=UPI0021F775AA|nr:capsular polysaccharide biosynthesis protein [Pararhizobium sp. BT-229]MCV9963514.1 capsular polysaccharide biosynthesis protein [Pararhizobium sp. BT-229]
MVDWFPDYDVRFVPMKVWPIDFEINWRWQILADRRSRVLAWQYKGLPKVKAFCARHGVPFHFVEDGFIRSVSLGALKAPPLSLVFDSKDMFFNANEPTDLEAILATYDFDADPVLMARSRAVIARLLSSRLSKYNSAVAVDIEAVLGPKDRKRVLVVGQVERDASIRYGSLQPYTNNDLVWTARRENPDAQVIYKPHPEVMQGTAEALSDPELVSEAAQILRQDISLADALDSADHVYTITSLSGFEALLRGIKVTTLGCPFYSGWGLTDDRQPNDRRHRRLTVEQIFAASYILYPRYFDPVARQPVEIEGALDILADMRTRTLAEGEGGGRCAGTGQGAPSPIRAG